ncbi:hypothetical protein E2I00_019560, partial [Balaenoptera physalus]
KPPSAHAMKEEAFLRRRFSLCPPSSTPQKVDPRKLGRTLLLGGENELDPLGPAFPRLSPQGCRLLGEQLERLHLCLLSAASGGKLGCRELAEGSFIHSFIHPFIQDAHRAPNCWCQGDAGMKSSPVELSTAEYRLCNGSDRECVSPTAKVTKKEALKAQKESYRQEKKRATKQLLSALTDPSVVVMADSLKPSRCPWVPGRHGRQRPSPQIRGTLKSWTKLWCVLKPGVLLIYKTPKVGQWVGTVLLHCCELIERPSKKDGFCFKLFHPLDQSVWAVKGPKGESVGSITQPLPSSYLIFRAASESDGKYLPALLVSMVTPPEAPLPLAGFRPGNDAFADKSERETAGDSDKETQDHRRKAQSGSDHRSRRTIPPAPPGSPPGSGCSLTALGEASQVETVSDEHKSLMWVLLKQLRPGMDLSRVVLPTFVLEPRSFLNKLSDYYYHADLLSRAALEEDAYSRIKLVLQWYLSGFYKKPKEPPLHPQVSHHPPVSAFHVSNRKDGFCVSGSITAKSRFYGNSLSALLDGKATLTFLNRVEDYTLTMPYAHCKGILYGTMTMELGGRVTVECEKNNFQAELEFKLKPFFGGSTSLNQVSGKITSGEEVLARLTGHWDREVFIKEEGRGGAELFWNPSEEIRGQRLKRHTVPLEEQTELESERLWQHVTRAISEGDQHKATQEKFALEEAQRQRARERQQNLVPWSPQLFQLDPASREWRYRYEDHSPWDPLKDIAQFEQDGVLHTLRRETMARQTTFLGSPGPRHQGSGPDRRLRKASDQPSGHSQATESSGSTPESCPELSDEEEEDRDFAPGCESPCPRCGKEAWRLQLLHEGILSIREAQQELHRWATLGGPAGAPGISRPC